MRTDPFYARFVKSCLLGHWRHDTAHTPTPERPKQLCAHERCRAVVTTQRSKSLLLPPISLRIDWFIDYPRTSHPNYCSWPRFTKCSSSYGGERMRAFRLPTTPVLLHLHHDYRSVAVQLTLLHGTVPEWWFHVSPWAVTRCTFHVVSETQLISYRVGGLKKSTTMTCLGNLARPTHTT